MPTLDSVLNWVIPLLVILIFSALIYSKVPQPFNVLINWFKKIWEKLTDTGVDEYQTVLKYE
jgi:hypothetical protein